MQCSFRYLGRAVADRRTGKNASVGQQTITGQARCDSHGEPFFGHRLRLPRLSAVHEARQRPHKGGQVIGAAVAPFAMELVQQQGRPLQPRHVLEIRKAEGYHAQPVHRLLVDAAGGRVAEVVQPSVIRSGDETKIFSQTQPNSIFTYLQHTFELLLPYFPELICLKLKSSVWAMYLHPTWRQPTGYLKPTQHAKCQHRTPPVLPVRQGT